MPIPDTTDVSTLIRFFKKDKPEWSHKQCVAVAMSVAKRNGAKDTDTTQEKKASYEAPQTGPEAILHALENMDLDQIEKEARDELKTGKRTKRSGAVARLNIVQGMRRNKQTPSDYIMSMVPIVPTKYRPFAAAGGTFIPGDANVLYKDLFDVLAAHKEEKEMYGKENAGSSLLDLYDAISSVQGYGEPVKAKTKAKEVKGFLEKIVGSTSKYSYVQRRLLSKTQDNTGRSTVVVDPELGIGEIGVPKDMAFTMYAPYIQRRLKQGGMRDTEALKHVKERTSEALRALEKEVTVRPVLWSRAPTWFRFGILGARPKLIDGSALAVNPYDTTGAGMDFDGDNQLNIIELRISEELYKSGILSPAVIKCLDKVSNSNYTTHMYENTKVPAVVNGMYQGSIHLADFPHGEFSNSVDGKKGRIDFYHVPDGVYVLAHDAHENRMAWKKVKYWSKHYRRTVEIVNLEDDMQIITDDDPRAVYGIPANADCLTPCRFTPSNAKIYNVCVPVLKDASRTVVEEYGEINIPGVGLVGMDRDFGEFLGMMAGDGWWDKKDYAFGNFSTRRLYLSDNEGYCANFVEEFIKKTWDANCYVTSKTYRKEDYPDRYGDTVRYQYSFSTAAPLSVWLSETLGGEGDDHTSGSGNKHLPTFFTRAPYEFRLGLLCGLVATDGTCSISNADAKNVPQLEISITSTSLRMLQEAHALCATLGIRSTISRSKKTTANNDAWVLSIRTVEAKRKNILATMHHPRKLEIFLNTHVDTSPRSIKNDRVPFPVCVSGIIRGWIYNAKTAENTLKGLPEEEKAYRKDAANVAQQFQEGATTSTITRASARRILNWLRDDVSRKRDIVNRAIEWLRSDDTAFTQELSDLMREALYATGLDDPATELYEQTRKLTKRLPGPLRSGKMGHRCKLGLLQWLEQASIPSCLDNATVLQWERQYVENEDTRWVRVLSVEKTNREEDGYDLTVPGYETFMSADGVVLSNTINVHVPSSDKAVKEAYERMMPQDTPFSDRQPDKIIPLPKQEQILGLYTAATAPATQPVVFNTEEEAMHAIRSGKVRLSQDIEVLNRERQPINTPLMKFPELQFTAVETPARIIPTNVKITEGPIVIENGRVTKPITLTYLRQSN